LQTVDLQLDERVRKLLKSADGSFIELEKESDLRAELCDDPTRRFFYLEVPGLRTAIGRQKIRFYKELRQGTPFDMQFGRVLACHLLNTKAKLNWQNCTLPKDQEQALVAKFRKELTD